MSKCFLEIGPSSEGIFGRGQNVNSGFTFQCASWLNPIEHKLDLRPIGISVIHKAALTCELSY